MQNTNNAYPNYVAQGTLVNFEELQRLSKVCQPYSCQPEIYKTVQNTCQTDPVCDPGYSYVRPPPGALNSPTSPQNSPTAFIGAGGLGFSGSAYTSQYTNPRHYTPGKGWDIVYATGRFPGSQIW